MKQPQVGQTVFYRVSPYDKPQLRKNRPKLLPATVVAVGPYDKTNLQIHPDGEGGSVWASGILKGNDHGQWNFGNEGV